MATVYYTTTNTPLKNTEINLALDWENIHAPRYIASAHEPKPYIIASTDYDAFIKACDLGVDKISEGGFLAINMNTDPGNPEGFPGEIMLKRMNAHHASVTEWGLGFFDEKMQGSILDIGCGGGAALAHMATNYPGSTLTGADYSQTSLQGSAEYNKALVKNGRLKLVWGDVSDLPFKDDSFDMIYTIECFYFWPDSVKGLSEVRRVLREGGKFLLISDVHVMPGMDPAFTEKLNQRGMYSPSEEVYEKLFEKAGFSETIIHTKGEWICVEGRK